MHIIKNNEVKLFLQNEFGDCKEKPDLCLGYIMRVFWGESFVSALNFWESSMAGMGATALRLAGQLPQHSCSCLLPHQRSRARQQLAVVLSLFFQAQLWEKHCST